MVNIQQTDDDPQDAVAIVSYIAYSDSPDIVIDVTLADYKQENGVDGLFRILKTLSKESCMVHTINMIKQGLMDAGEGEALLTLLTKVGKDLILKTEEYTEKEKDESPCISPSDMM